MDVLDESNLDERKLVVAMVEGREICFLKQDGSLYAFSNVCTHIGGLLSKGILSPNLYISCPEHRATFDVRTGKSVSFPRRGITIYPVRLKNGKVQIKMKGLENYREEFPTLDSKNKWLD